MATINGHEALVNALDCLLEMAEDVDSVLDKYRAGRSIDSWHRDFKATIRDAKTALAKAQE